MADTNPIGAKNLETIEQERSKPIAASLFKKTSIVSGMTLASRVLGLIRDVVFARFFGASIIMDAFIVANRIPNMLRRFFAEGAFSQGFVPVVANYRESKTHREVRDLIDSVSGTFGLILFLITLIGVIASPFLVAIVAPGFIGDDGRFDLAALMLRFTFPYLMFISLTGMAGGILNTYGKFGASSFTPIILNVVLIIFIVWLSPYFEEPGMALAYGVFIAGLIQLTFQIPFLSRINLIPRPRWNPKHSGLRRVGKLMLPALFGSSIAQLNILVGGVIASLLGVGKISLLYYSDRLMEFPLGLFSIALATVTLPYLSRQYALKQSEIFSETIDWSMKLVFLLVVPAASGLIILADPIIITVFLGGEFSEFDADMTALSLQAFAIGLIGFSLVKILAPAYFAREDTVTPVKIGLISLFTNFCLSIIFVYILVRVGYEGTHAGLALAISISALLNAWLLYSKLSREKIIHHSSGWFKLITKLFMANLIMTVILINIRGPVSWWVNASLFNRVSWLLLIIVAGMSVYFVALYLLGLRASFLKLKHK